MSSLDLILDELRATAPAAPDSLRARVRALTSASSAPPLRQRFGSRRLALVLVPACVAVAVAGVFAGARGGSGAEDRAAVGTAPQEFQTVVHSRNALEKRTPEWQTATKALDFATPAAPTAGGRLSAGAKASTTAQQGVKGGAILSPSRTRLQHYDVSLRLRVKDQEALSEATNEAMRLTRGFGGYVAGVDYSSNESTRGDATLTLRVPVGKIDTAIARFSKLGTIAAQHVSIQDLQSTVNAQNRAILETRKRIATIEEMLADSSLTAARRIELQHQLAGAQSRLKGLLGARGGTIREGRLTTVSLSFTTAKRQAGGASQPGRIERAADDAVALLARVGAAVVYLVIVLSPVLALALLAFLTRRTLRRREETRLLAQT